MANRISAGVLLFKNDKLLLIRHIDPKNNHEFWVPPGGGVQKYETIYETAKREVLEESGLHAEIIKIAYIRQFIDKSYKQNNLSIYFIGEIISGEETIKNIKGKGIDEHFIKEVKYFNKEEIQKINIFPKMLKDQMWKDKEKGFPTIQFIGVDKDFE